MAIVKEKNPKKWTKDGKKYYYTYSYVDEYGKRKRGRSKLFSREEVKTEYSLFLTKNEPNNKFKDFTIIAEDYFNYLSSIRKESTEFTYRRDYNNHIKSFFDKMNIYTISTRNIKEWAEEIKNKGLSVKYMNKIKNVLNNIFDFAIKNYDLKNNPSKDYGRFQQKNEEVIEDEDKIRYITLDEFNKFISVIENPLWKTFFIFAYYTGCRKGEIQALTWKDVDFDNNEIKISKTLTVKSKSQYKITNTKNKENRKIKMSKILKNTLYDYKQEIKKYSDYSEDWFIFGNSYFMPQTTIDREKDKYFKLSGVRRITMHEFRHSHVSLLINEYVKISKEKNMQIDTAKFFLMMSDRMGHTIQVMQETYMHLFPTIQDEIVDLLDNI